MKELCIPIPNLRDQEVAEVQVTLSGKEVRYRFRVESFPWETGEEFALLTDPLERSLARIYGLKTAIDEYDRDWELLQIFNPEENSGHIHVLYRKKS